MIINTQKIKDTDLHCSIASSIILSFSENETIFNVIIDNRLARASLNKSILYCMKLRELDEEANSLDSDSSPDDSYPSPAKRARLSNVDVFLPPLDPVTLPANDEMISPPNQTINGNDKMQICLPTVPCIPSISVASSASSTANLSPHLSRPHLNIPSLPLDKSHKLSEVSNQHAIPMPDISSLITKQNILCNAIASSHSILQDAIEPRVAWSTSMGEIPSVLQANSIKLPINLSTLVPVSKHSLNMDNLETNIPPIPITSASCMLGAKQNQQSSLFSLNLLPNLPPFWPTTSQVSNETPERSIISESSSSLNHFPMKESKPSNTATKRGRLSSSKISQDSTLVWPGVDTIVESFKKYNQGEIH